MHSLSELQSKFLDNKFPPLLCINYGATMSFFAKPLFTASNEEFDGLLTFGLVVFTASLVIHAAYIFWRAHRDNQVRRRAEREGRPQRWEILWFLALAVVAFPVVNSMRWQFHRPKVALSHAREARLQELGLWDNLKRVLPLDRPPQDEHVKLPNRYARSCRASISRRLTSL